MIEEFAIDPECFADSRILSILQQCGFSKGRVICDFPRKNWGKNLHEALNSAPSTSEMERKKIETLLENLKTNDKAIVRRKSSGYDRDLSWLSNACIEHARFPFKGMVAISNPDSNASVVELGTHDDESSAWNVKTPIAFEMSESEFAKRTHPLLKYSETVRFIDPYVSSTSREALKKFKSVVESAYSHRAINRAIKVEIHFCIDKNKDDLERTFGKLKSAINFPEGTSVTLVGWPKNISATTKMHNRYVLTERGGIMFGSGFNEVLKDDAALLSEDRRAELWDLFDVPDSIGCGKLEAPRKDQFVTSIPKNGKNP